MARGVGKLADKGDLGDKAAVAGLVDKRAEEHQQARHDNERREQREENGFDEAQRHIGAELELHEEHGDQTADGRERAGADLGDGLAQRHNDRLAQGQGAVLLLEAVAKDDGVVDGECQLQDARHGIGDERDFAHHEVRALIEHERDHKGQNQDRHLAVGLGGEEQHGDNDDGDIDHNDADLVVDGLLLRVAEVGGDIEIVAGERVLDALERVETALVVLVVVKSDGEERTDVVVVLVGLVERHALHALDILQLLLQIEGVGEREVGDHHARCAEGGELLVHDVERLAGLGIGGEIGGQVVFHLHPAAGEDGEDQPDDDDKKDKVAFIDDEAGELEHKALAALFRWLCHRRTSCIVICPAHRAPRRKNRHLLYSTDNAKMKYGKREKSVNKRESGCA